MNVAKESQAEWVRDIRSRLGLSQSELARSLGLSPRAVQSYEQGWRTVPRPIATHLMTLLALHLGHPDQAAPCWTLTGCPEERRAKCPSAIVGKGRFCWLLSGGSCGSRPAAGCAGALPCTECIVFRKIIDGPSQPIVAGAAPYSRSLLQEEMP
jgi:DNA-binding XRE family transcriptional regulator